MKAAQISEYGGPDVIKISKPAQPEPGPEQVVVRVRAASINPFDAKVRSGLMRAVRPLRFPATLGGDIAGEIHAVGPRVLDYKPGDMVFGQAGVFGGGTGALAEYAGTGIDQIGLMPDGSSFEEAASVVLVGLSALEALQDTAKLQPGQKILIHGGAGGIGSVAIQLARHIGAEVTATAGGGDLDYVHSLGADRVIDYKTEHFEQLAHDQDVVFDTVGGEVYRRSFAVVRKGGIVVSMIEPPDQKLIDTGVRAELVFTKTTTAELGRLAALVESGAIKPQIAEVFDLDKTVEAFEALDEGVRGKVVVSIS